MLGPSGWADATENIAEDAIDKATASHFAFENMRMGSVKGCGQVFCDPDSHRYGRSLSGSGAACCRARTRGVWPRRNRRNRMGSRRRPVCTRPLRAPPITLALGHMLPRRPHPVSRAPTTIGAVVTHPGVVVVKTDLRIGVVPVITICHGATGQRKGDESEHEGCRCPAGWQDVHLVSSLLCSSGHSSSPKGAPRGSATMATLPP